MDVHYGNGRAKEHGAHIFVLGQAGPLVVTCPTHSRVAKNKKNPYLKLSTIYRPRATWPLSQMNLQIQLPGARRRLRFLRFEAGLQVVAQLAVKTNSLVRSEITVVRTERSELRVMKHCTLHVALTEHDPGENPIREQAMYKYVQRLRGTGRGSEFIIKVFDTVVDGNVVVSQLEYCPGGDLLQAIERNYLPTANAKKHFFTQACMAVSFLHAHDIVHRDISPENMLIGSDGNCRLADFGVACVLSGALRDGRFCGKDMYRSPEQNLGGHYSGKASDVFALGVSLFALLTNRGLFGVAHPDDETWWFLNNVGIAKLVEVWGLQDKVSCSAAGLLRQMLCPEQRRISIEGVLTHPFLVQLEESDEGKAPTTNACT